MAQKTKFGAPDNGDGVVGSKPQDEPVSGDASSGSVLVTLKLTLIEGGEGKATEPSTPPQGGGSDDAA